ncbi:MAG: maleylpyruvate isomerase family mycothiol-dependent enzyme [Actinomycetota bacterium]|nr:maleylpyruvate isomerase family mycothiol-dependent enzyme [Actinomycetota bacterium]
MTGSGEAYADTRRRIVDVVKDLDKGETRLVVPACPAWTVRDLIAHLAAVAVDMSKGNLEGVGSEEWTLRQLDDRIDRTLDELLDEWAGIAGQVEGALEYLPKWAASMLVGDTVTHEHDLRGAVVRPGARDSDAVKISANGYARWFGRKVKDAGLPAVLVKWADGEWVAGNGEPAVTVGAPTFEMLRGLTGRRTRAEVAAFDWSDDPGPYLDLFSYYGMPERSLGE